MAWLWGIWGSGEEKRKFEVLIYEEDYKELCAHVLEKPEIETGGDLFGLWLDEHKAVIQVALGPGKACRRSSTSFYQDVNYLARVGSHLTKNEGLCHIGEWHSHHQLGLAQPSGGDERTVWNNMPTYNLSKFVIFIANIEASHPSYKVNIRCFLFEIDSRGYQLPVLPGEFRILQSENPFSRKKEVKFERNNGAETSTGRSEETNINIKNLELKEDRTGAPAVIMLRRNFEVFIYEEDYKEMCAHVLRKPSIETGGDLFGLWLDERKAVVQLALGPGKECKRTSNSFYQDVSYLAKVGSYLTKKEGVCHIGEWHSHHQLGLARPSGGDESTVWSNMPTYKLSRFVIFIANIEASSQNYKVNIGCFLFEMDSKGKRLPVKQGAFKILPSKNPFWQKNEVYLERRDGEENPKGDMFDVDIKDFTLVKGVKSPHVTMQRPRIKRNSPRADDPNAPPKKKGNGYGRGKGTETSGRSPQEREENLARDTNCEDQKHGDRTVDDSRKGREKEHGIDGEKESQKIENQLPTGSEESKEKGEEVKSGVISGGADQMGTSNHDNKEVAQQTKNGPEAARDPFDGKKKDVSTGDSEVQGKEKEGGRKRNEDGTPSANEIEKKKEDEESTEDGNEDTMQVQTKTEAENKQKNAEEGPSPVIQQPAPINHQDSNVRDDGPRSIGGSKGESAVQENEKQEERGRGESGRPDAQEGEKETEEAGGKETPQDHERGENEGLKAGAKEKKTEIAENIQAEGKETHDNDQPTNRSARDQGDHMKRDLKKAVKHNGLAEEETLTLAKPSTKKEQ